MPCLDSRRTCLHATILLAAMVVSTARAELVLSDLFTDGVVLQQQTQAPIWGWARPGETITVLGDWKIEGKGASATAKADEHGLWLARLRTPAAGGPFTLTATTAPAAGAPATGSGAVPAGETRTVRDVLVGEVWLCSGQSNMEWALGQAGTQPREAEATIAAANHPTMRFFVVPNVPSPRPTHTFPTKPAGWQPCTPAVASGFSAVAYHFGRALQEKLGMPVGLLSADGGGTTVEAWMPAEALKSIPRFSGALDSLAASDPDPAVRAAKLKEIGGNWWARLDTLPGAPGAGWNSATFDDKAWPTSVLPASFSGDGLESFDGVVYLRRAIDLPEAWKGQPAELGLGPIDDRDETFINGLLVGATRDDGKWAVPRRYDVPANVLKAGRNIIAIRVLDTGGVGGVNGKPEQMTLRLANGGGAVQLAGDWKRVRGAAAGALPPMDGGMAITAATPTALFNGMIAPLVPFALRGAIWYQGESNRYDPALYAKMFPDMIRAWRGLFGADLAFEFVQIAPFAYPDDRGETAALRDAQAAALALPRTGMVVTLDVGDPKDIHPRNKRTVGDRLAALALADVYGKADVAARSPRLAESTIEEGRVRVHFDQVGGGLKASPAGLGGFAIAGEDRRFHDAEARIEGETVVVWSESVPKPVAVRYAWSAAPSASLFAANGLPVAPFRTDAWPAPEGGWPAPADRGATSFLSKDPDLKPIFNGRDLAGWSIINVAPGTFSVRDGVIFCTGKPTGLLRTDAMYENFVLECEWKHLEAQGNAGLFVWSDGMTARGQPFTRALEVQVMVGSEGDWFTSDGDIFPIHGATMTPENPRNKGSRAFPTEKRMKPAGEWNHYLVTCNNGDISLAVNGKVVTRGHNAVPRKGYICLESEGTPIEFRNIRIKELPPSSPPPKPEQVASSAEGFVPIFNGIDLDGWKLDDDAKSENHRHWIVDDWILRYDGKGGDLWSTKSYRDFQMIVDWRLPAKPVETEHPVFGADGLEQKGPDGKLVTAKVPDAGDSGIYLRGSSKSQVNIWCWPCGSGEVYGYRTDANQPAEVRKAVAPRERADNPLGEWNRFLITMKGDRLTVVLNGKTVIENAQLPGVAAEGPIALQSHGDPVEFANIFVRELPR
ncbi:MAG: family 16 glycoside hydrolase [Phycisphaerales bacterium]